MANTKHAKPGPRTATGRTVHTIKVTLRGSQPPIWRRLEVPSGSTLQQLHNIIQSAFGWEDYHMWAFETPQERYGVADGDLGIPARRRSGSARWPHASVTSSATPTTSATTGNMTSSSKPSPRPSPPPPTPAASPAEGPAHRRTAPPVGLEYTIAAVACVFSQQRGACQAAIRYSCVSPPGTCLRRIRCSARLLSGGRV